MHSINKGKMSLYCLITNLNPFLTVIIHGQQLRKVTARLLLKLVGFFSTFALPHIRRMEPYIDIHSHDRNSISTHDIIVFHSYRLGSGEPLPPHPFSVGIHPWDVCKPMNIAALLDYLVFCKADAIGETGLDFSRGRREAKEQRSIFRSQVETASKRQLPIFIHCVRAFEEVMKILKEYPLTGVIFHGYIGSPQQAARIAEAGYYISAGPTSLRSPKTVASLCGVPHKLLFLETDDTGLSIEDIYSKAADMLQIPLPQLKSSIYENFKRLFPLL